MGEGLPTGLLTGVADVTTEALIDSLVLTVETRTKQDNDDKQEYRYVASITIHNYKNNVRQISDISTTLTDEVFIAGRFNGGPEVFISLTSGGSWNLAQWNLVGESMDPLGDGSKFVKHTQSWVAATDWSTAPWDV